MKDRPAGFIGDDKLDHDGEVFDYIKELHGYLWRFVLAVMPGAGGNLSDYVDAAITTLENKGNPQ